MCTFLPTRTLYRYYRSHEKGRKGPEDMNISWLNWLSSSRGGWQHWLVNPLIPVMIVILLILCTVFHSVLFRNSTTSCVYLTDTKSGADGMLIFGVLSRGKGDARPLTRERAPGWSVPCPGVIARCQAEEEW